MSMVRASLNTGIKTDSFTGTLGGQTTDIAQS